MNFYIVYVDGVNAGYMPASNLWEAQQKAEEAWSGYDDVFVGSPETVVD